MASRGVLYWCRPIREDHTLGQCRTSRKACDDDTVPQRNGGHRLAVPYATQIAPYAVSVQDSCIAPTKAHSTIRPFSTETDSTICDISTETDSTICWISTGHRISVPDKCKINDNSGTKSTEKRGNAVEIAPGAETHVTTTSLPVHVGIAPTA
eukprot:2109127-Rhodomonas_salina.1